jgi:hypothetical protein
MGIIKEESTILDPKNLDNVVGPSVHLYGHDEAQQLWYGSVLLAMHTKCLGQQGAVLTYQAGSGAASDVRAEVMHAQDYGGDNWSVMRCASPARGMLRAPAAPERLASFKRMSPLPHACCHQMRASWHASPGYETNSCCHPPSRHPCLQILHSCPAGAAVFHAAVSDQGRGPARRGALWQGRAASDRRLVACSRLLVQ